MSEKSEVFFRIRIDTETTTWRPCNISHGIGLITSIRQDLIGLITILHL